MTASFTVTSVRVVGPLYGLQSRNGYDMPPDTRLTPGPAAALLHALEVRTDTDGLGRPVRVDPAGADRGRGRAGAPVSRR